MICSICKGIKFIDLEEDGAKFKICENCGYIIQTQQSDEYDKAVEKATLEREQKNIRPTVECPYCHSKDTKKISSLSKAGSVALFGVFALGKTSKQWHCNKCNSDF